MAKIAQSALTAFVSRYHRLMSDVASMAAATPDTRDRYVDFLRVASLGGVMVGHFMMAAIIVGGSSGMAPFSFTNILSVEPATRAATLLFQVMPIFFAVGGFAHAVAWRSVRRRGGGFADFVYARISRLVRPALVFIALWTVTAIVVEEVSEGDDSVAAVLQVSGQLLWFIGIYLIAAACAPLMLAAHDRWGWRVLAVLGTLAAAVDIARLGADVPGVMWLNFLFVWLAVHQLGFFYADGVADRVGDVKLGAVLLVLGGSATALLIVAGPYGTAMVSYPGEALSNLAPPTVVLLTFAVAQQGLLLMLRPAATRWLATPSVWKGVIVGGGVAMTAYLWHFTALIGMYAGFYFLGAPVFPEPGTASWWLWRFPLLLVFLTLVAVLVLVFRGFDRPSPRAGVVGRSWVRGSAATVGVVCAIVGMVGFAVVGFRGVLVGYSANVAGVPVTSAGSSALVAGSALLTWLAVRPSRQRGEGEPGAAQDSASSGSAGDPNDAGSPAPA